MRYSLKEGILFGVSIAVAVLLIRAFGSRLLVSELVILLFVALLLAAVQFMLSLRRARSHDDTAPPPRPERPRRTRPQDPFALEKNQAWTGLSSTIMHEQVHPAHADSAAEEQSSESPQAASDPVRSDTPTANRRSF